MRELYRERETVRTVHRKRKHAAKSCVEFVDSCERISAWTGVEKKMSVRAISNRVREFKRIVRLTVAFINAARVPRLVGQQFSLRTIAHRWRKIDHR